MIIGGLPIEIESQISKLLIWAPILIRNPPEVWDLYANFIVLGPLLVEENGRYVVAGVVSWGYDCGSYGYPGVYARVTTQLSWILDSIGNEELLCETDPQKGNCTK